jgi:hypothetical protein
LSSWAPTVAPICASSPAAWTAVVTISVPRGGPLGRPSGSGGGTRVGARFGAAATGFVGLGFVAFAFLAAGFAAVVFEAVCRAEARRSPPILVGRVERRLPRTLGSAALLAFLAFFFADFWVTKSSTEREFPELALGRGTVNA